MLNGYQFNRNCICWMQFRLYFLHAGPLPVAVLYAREAWVVVLYALQLYHSEMDEVPRSAVNGVVCSSLSFSCLHFFRVLLQWLCCTNMKIRLLCCMLCSCINSNGWWSSQRCAICYWSSIKVQQVVNQVVFSFTASCIPVQVVKQLVFSLTASCI